MKTPLDLDDDLLTAAKALAVRRRTTLKAMVEQALRREINPPSTGEQANDFIKIAATPDRDHERTGGRQDDWECEHDHGKARAGERPDTTTRAGRAAR